MANVNNKLPTFGSSAQTDSAIVDNSSSLKDTGFESGTLIQSSQVNTYIKMLVNIANGLVEAFSKDSSGQTAINALSTLTDFQDYITKGLTSILENATVLKAKSADKLNTDAGSTSTPVYFLNGIPVEITGSISNDTTGNANTASKLKNTRNVTLNGDATGTGSFDGSQDLSITVDVLKSAALDSTNIGDSTHPVYFNAEGKPVRIEKVASSSNADTATNLSKKLYLHEITVSNASTDSGSEVGAYEFTYHFYNSVSTAYTDYTSAYNAAKVSQNWKEDASHFYTVDRGIMRKKADSSVQITSYYPLTATNMGYGQSIQFRFGTGTTSSLRLNVTVDSNAKTVDRVIEIY